MEHTREKLWDAPESEMYEMCVLPSLISTLAAVDPTPIPYVDEDARRAACVLNALKRLEDGRYRLEWRIDMSERASRWVEAVACFERRELVPEGHLAVYFDLYHENPAAPADPKVRYDWVCAHLVDSWIDRALASGALGDLSLQGAELLG